jgi:ATP-dependent helicase Lhr and Lhr-like helicase
MFAVYVSPDVPVFLDPTARELLAEGRAHFQRNQLATQSLVERGCETLLLCWRGDRVLDTIQLMLQQRGIPVQRDGLVLAAQGIRRPALEAAICDLVAAGVPDAQSLAATVENRWSEKYDRFLTDDLMALEYAARHLEVRGAWETLADIVPAGDSTQSVRHPVGMLRERRRL